MNSRNRAPRRGTPPRARRTRRRGHPLPVVIAVLVLALVTWVVVINHVLIVRSIVVNGNGGVSEQEVIHLSGLRLGSRMRSLDAQAVSQGVESDGRLAFIDMEKRYPSTVMLMVRERTKDALILQAGKILLLDSDGFVVSASDHLPEQSVPYVTGLKPSTYQLGRQLDVADGRLNAMKAVVEALKAQGATGYVSELSVENIADLRIITRTGMEVLLGDASDMPNKILWMTGTLKDLESRGETVGRLDVSSGNKADFLSAATPTPAPTPEPTSDPNAVAEGDGAIIGENAI